MESLILFTAGVIVIPSLFLASWLFGKIMEVRDRGRAVYKFSGSSRYRDITPDITQHPVRIVRLHQGVQVQFVEFDPDCNEHLIYTVDLKKVDKSHLD